MENIKFTVLQGDWRKYRERYYASSSKETKPNKKWNFIVIKNRFYQIIFKKSKQKIKNKDRLWIM